MWRRGGGRGDSSLKVAAASTERSLHHCYLELQIIQILSGEVMVFLETISEREKEKLHTSANFQIVTCNLLTFSHLHPVAAGGTPDTAASVRGEQL